MQSAEMYFLRLILLTRFREFAIIIITNQLHVDFQDTKVFILQKIIQKGNKFMKAKTCIKKRYP